MVEAADQYMGEPFPEQEEAVAIPVVPETNLPLEKSMLLVAQAAVLLRP